MTPDQRTDETSKVLHAVAGFGAWITAGFLMMLLGLMGFIAVGGAASVATALGLGFAAFVLNHFGNDGSPFRTQLVLAASFAAQGTWLLSAIELHPFAIVAMMSIFGGAMYAAVPSTTNRFVTTMIVGLTASVVAMNSLHALSPVLFFAEVALVCGVFAQPPGERQEFVAALRPAAYGAALLALGTVTQGFSVEFWEHLPTFSRVVVAVAAVVMVVLAHREHCGDHRRLIAVTAAIGLLGLLTTPAILLAMLVAGLGLWRRCVGLTAMGATALIVHLSTYYYLLDTTLLMKSGVLVASGITALALRHVAFAHEGANT